MICTDSEQHTITISPALYKICKYAFFKYEADLERQREEKIAVEEFLKRKSTEDELQNAKKQKIDLETSVTALREGLVKETLAADKIKNIAILVKVWVWQFLQDNNRPRVLLSSRQHGQFNPFHATDLFWYPLKTWKLENMFSGGIKRDQWHEMD